MKASFIIILLSVIGVLAPAAPIEAQDRIHVGLIIEEVVDGDGDIFLNVRATSTYDMGPSTLAVRLVARKRGGSCTYRNDRAMWADNSWTRLSGGFLCLLGADFPIDQLATVEATYDKGALSKERELSCSVDLYSGESSRNRKRYNCRTDG